MMYHEKPAAIEAVESIIQYKFKNADLLWEALNTKPLINPGCPIPEDGNKRLAIVGDTVLQLALAEDWYKGNTNRGHWAGKIISKIGANANLDRQARALGLERFINGPLGGKAVADTVEAILGAIYFDSNMENAKAVVEVLDLLTPARRIEKELHLEGFVELKEDDLEDLQPKKRRRTQAFTSTSVFDAGSAVHERRRPKRSLRLGHGRVEARLGATYSLPTELCSPQQLPVPDSTAQLDFIEID